MDRDGYQNTFRFVIDRFDKDALDRLTITIWVVGFRCRKIKVFDPISNLGWVGRGCAVEISSRLLG